MVVPPIVTRAAAGRIERRARPQHARGDDADHPGDDDVHHRRDHDRDDGIGRRLVCGGLHQDRQPDPEQIEAIEPEQRADDTERGDQVEHPGDPRRGVRISGDLHRLVLALGTGEIGRKRVDHQRQHPYPGQRADIAQRGRDQRRYQAGAEMDEQRADPEHLHADEAADRGDRGERHRPAHEHALRGVGLGVDRLPFLGGLSSIRLIRPTMPPAGRWRPDRVLGKFARHGCSPSSRGDPPLRWRYCADAHAK